MVHFKEEHEAKNTNIDTVSHAEMKKHISRVLGEVTLKSNVVQSVYFFVICVLFSITLYNLSVTNRNLETLFDNQQTMLRNQSIGTKERNQIKNSVNTIKLQGIKK